MQTELWKNHSELDRSLALMASIKTLFLILSDLDLLEREKLEDFHNAATEHVEALGGESAVAALNMVFQPHYLGKFRNRERD